MIEDDKAHTNSEPDQTLDNNGSLASPHILDYGAALTTDLLQNYPDIDGIRIDWPEIPPYFLETVFTDFGPHVEQFARNNGFDFEDIRNLANDTHQRFFGSLTDKDLEAFIETPSCSSDLRISEERAKLKTSIVANLLQHFATPWMQPARRRFDPQRLSFALNQLSGFDYAMEER